MTAKELFETLGYKQTTNDDSLIEYKSVNHVDSDYVYITFYLGWEEYEVGFANIHQIETGEVVPLTIKEHKAITKQMKELGWI